MLTQKGTLIIAALMILLGILGMAALTFSGLNGGPLLAVSWITWLFGMALFFALIVKIASK